MQLIHTVPGEYDADGNETKAPVVTVAVDEPLTDDERHNAVRARCLQLEAMQRNRDRPDGGTWSFRSEAPEK